MNLLLRLAFIGAILLAVGCKTFARSSAVPGDDPARSIQAALEGRISGPARQVPGTDGMVLLSVPVIGCAKPLLVAPTSPSLSGLPELSEFVSQRNRSLFAYLDWVSTRPDRGAVLWIRYRNRLLRLVGLSPYAVARRDMLFISEPPECRVAAGLPWRRYWFAR